MLPAQEVFKGKSASFLIMTLGRDLCQSKCSIKSVHHISLRHGNERQLSRMFSFDVKSHSPLYQTRMRKNSSRHVIMTSAVSCVRDS